MISAKIIKSSRNTHTGDVLTTIKVVYPRIILAEVNTHRVFSRNTASSRAIPTKKQRRDIISSPFIPQHIGKNQSGMQAYEELRGWRRGGAELIIDGLRYISCGAHWALEKLGCHKQVANRYIEPWMYVTQLISSTEWDNFLAQRYHKDAEPHIYKLAECVREVLSTNTPQNLKSGEWHVPYANTDLVIESIDGYLPEVQIEVDSLKSAAANCARLSYEVPGENKIATYEDNIRLFKRLAGSQPKHLSPLEHVAQCTINPKTSNFTGFTQLRKFYE